MSYDQTPPPYLNEPIIKEEGNKAHPHSKDAEISVIGGMILNPKGTISKVLDILNNENNFYNEKHKIIYSSIVEMYDENKEIDLLTLTEYLKKKGDLEKIGGSFYLTEITLNTISSANIEHHAIIVLEKYIRREVITTSGDLLNNAYKDEIDILDYIDEVEQKIFKLGEARFSNTYKTPKDIAKNFLDNLQKKINGEYHSISYFIPKLNKYTGGAHGGDVIVIAGSTSMGKTQFAHDIIRDFTFNKKLPVGLFSLEMAEEQNFMRQLQLQEGIAPEKVRVGKYLTSNERNTIKEFAKKFASSKLYIETKPGMTTREFVSTARRMKKELNIQALFIDHIGLMQYSGKAQNREQEIAKISALMKATALELDIPVFPLVQLNRSVSLTKDKRPNLSHLRDSGRIEEDADTIIMLYRPKYYKFNNVNIKGVEYNSDGMTELLLEKNRQGSTVGSIWCKSNDRTHSLLEFDTDTNNKYNFEPAPMPNGFKNYYEKEEAVF